MFCANVAKKFCPLDELGFLLWCRATSD